MFHFGKFLGVKFLCWLNVLARDKHSSLFCFSINDVKKFYDIGTLQERMKRQIEDLQDKQDKVQVSLTKNHILDACLISQIRM
jgi:hypothetical protein